MLEVILSLGCYFSNGGACLKAAEAYYYHTGANKIVDDLSQKHRAIALGISTLGAIRDNKASVPIYQKEFIVIASVGKNEQSLLFIKSF